MSGIPIPNPDGGGGLQPAPPLLPLPTEGKNAIIRKNTELRGVLGPPVTRFAAGADGGVVRHLANGSIYWHPAVGAHDVLGAIRDRYSQFGAEASFLGYPVTDETVAPDGVGRFNHFQGGSIYFHPDLGAHEVHGSIRNRWASLGSERSYLGYPVAEEADTTTGNGGRVAEFQNGSIFSRSGDMLEAPDTIVLGGPLVTEETIGGSFQLIVNSRGDFSYTGHVHNSGILGLNVSVVSALQVRGSDGRAFVAREPEPPDDDFNVAGFAGVGPRDHNWEKVGTDAVLRDNWAAIRSSQMTTRIEVGTSVGHVIELVLTGLFFVLVPVFFLTGGTGGTKCAKNCPDGSVVFFECGTPEPEHCIEHF